MNDSESLFRFTRGRFVQNEAKEMAARYIRFDVEELGKIAAKAIGSKTCVKVDKLEDGMHNKALLLTMEDSRQVVAKIPNPHAGQPHFTTASEVATMDLMRNYLKTPVPKVHAWCSRAEESLVGTEYIIMEQAPGVPLKSVWHKLSLADRFTVTKDIARMQDTWTSVSYQGYGSIYFVSDLPRDSQMPLTFERSSTPDKSFALGPITGRDWNDEGRQTVEFDRGPWATLEAYLEAVGRRELTCTREMPDLPPTQVTLCGPGTYTSTREKKSRALEYYIQIFKHLVPEDPDVSKASAWHGDLHLENIFVDESEPTRITSLIDWQSTEVAPLFVQVRQPYILDYNGPQASGLEPPCLPPDFSTLSSEEQNAANTLLLDQSLCIAYKRWTRSQYSEIWKCFKFQETPAYELFLHARTILEDGEALYSARVVEHLQSKSDILEGSGLSISEHTMADIMADSEGALRGMNAMTSIQEALGPLFPERGCVTPDQYDETKDALRQCKEQIIDTFASTEEDRIAWKESWPWDD